FSGWRSYPVADIPGDRLTHLCYAFAGIRDGRISVQPHHAPATTQSSSDNDELPQPMRDQFPELLALKQKHPQLRTLISIGGWGGSGEFSDVALTDASRATFAASCAVFVSRHGFDGVDIDWEYPVSGGPD